MTLLRLSRSCQRAVKECGKLSLFPGGFFADEMSAGRSLLLRRTTRTMMTASCRIKTTHGLRCCHCPFSLPLFLRSQLCSQVLHSSALFPPCGVTLNRWMRCQRELHGACMRSQSWDQGDPQWCLLVAWWPVWIWMEAREPFKMLRKGADCLGSNLCPTTFWLYNLDHQFPYLHNGVMITILNLIGLFWEWNEIITWKCLK